VGVTIVLAFIVRQGVGLPEDFRYSYWTVLVGLVSSAITLGVVVLIAGRGNLRELLALRRPTSWWRAGLIGVLVVVGTGLLLVLLPAIALTGLTFALSHGLLLPLIAIAAFGFGLAYLRSRTRSVYPGILIHMPVNLASSAP